MAKKWREVEQSEGFKKLSSQEQSEAKQEYFDGVVAPQVPEEDRGLALNEFMGSVKQPTPQKQERPSILSQLVRTLMRGSPIEQLKTSRYALENVSQMPTPQEGQSLEEFSKSWQTALQPREEEIARKGTLPQLEEPMMGALAVTGAQAPAQLLKGLLKFGALESLAQATGLSEAIHKIPQPELRDVADIAKVGIEGALATKKWIPTKTQENIGKQMANIAGNAIDSLIKPRHREYLFGKDPGKAVAREGITATNLGNLKDKVRVRIGEVKQAISNVRSSSDNFDKNIDATHTLNPLIETRNKLIKLGRETHSSEIAKIERIITDIKSSGKNLDALSIPEAYELKEALSSFQDWGSTSESAKFTNGAIRRAYHLTDKLIDNKIPELAQLNERISNLISAKQAIDHRMEVLRNLEPLPTVSKLINLPFAPLRTVVAKTTLAKLLATKTKYPKLSIK